MGAAQLERVQAQLAGMQRAARMHAIRLDHSSLLSLPLSAATCTSRSATILWCRWCEGRHSLPTSPRLASSKSAPRKVAPFPAPQAKAASIAQHEPRRASTRYERPSPFYHCRPLLGSLAFPSYPWPRVRSNPAHALHPITPAPHSSLPTFLAFLASSLSAFSCSLRSAGGAPNRLGRSSGAAIQLARSTP